MDYIETGTKDFWKTSGALFAGGFVTFAILYSTQPLLPEFSREFHILPAVSSLALSLTTGTLAIALLISAVISGRWGRKNIMGWSLLLSSVIAVFSSFSPDFLSLLLLRIVQGIVLAGMPSIAMAYVGEEFDTKSLGTAMGLYVSGTSIGGMFGRIIVGMISDYFSWKMALGTVGIVSILCSLWFWAELPKEEHFKSENSVFTDVYHSFTEHLGSLRLICLFGIGFLLMGGFVTLFNYIGYLLIKPPYNLNQTEVGWIFIVYLFGTFSSTEMGKLADMKGRGPALTGSLAIMLSGLIATLIPSLLLKIIGVAVFTFGFFGCHSIASGWVGKIALNNKAQAASLYLFFYYMGSSLIGTLGGTVWHLFEWKGIVFLIGLCIVFAFSLETTLLRGEHHYEQWHKAN
ncbi:MFS transporter [Sporolactobacillus sp. THM7-4]|nr:MFS transporter [Sporolactobacillus sp. THM7-4]